MHKLLAAALTRFGVIAAEGGGGKPFEASMNFEVEALPLFLARLNTELALSLDVPGLITFVQRTGESDERSMRFQVTFQDRPTPMEYRVFRDDAYYAYIYFLTDSQAL
ncbi:MAG TPA: hypothetical protein VLA30_00760, partial [Burkholderiales bacterium]|nr:hypothetical protein [Burkholderiales bacterium]